MLIDLLQPNVFKVYNLKIKPVVNQKALIAYS